MVSDDLLNVNLNDTNNIIERYVLTSFFFVTGGGDGLWVSNYNFLSISPPWHWSVLSFSMAWHKMEFLMHCHQKQYLNLPSVSHNSKIFFFIWFALINKKVFCLIHSNLPKAFSFRIIPFDQIATTWSEQFHLKFYYLHRQEQFGFNKINWYCSPFARFPTASTGL